MKNKIDIVLILFVFSFFMFNLYQCMSIKGNINGKYFCGNYPEESLIIELHEKGDSLVGNHSFVAYSGNKIDWCDEETTLFLTRHDKHIFMGYIHDCYEDDRLRIFIIPINKMCIKLIFNDMHPFLMDTLTFYKQSK